jgi:hypothetical protein
MVSRLMVTFSTKAFRKLIMASHRLLRQLPLSAMLTVGQQQPPSASPLPPPNLQTAEDVVSVHALVIVNKDHFPPFHLYILYVLNRDLIDVLKV